MALLRPDPSFYPSARLAMQGPPETLAYVAALDPDRQRPDAMLVVDLDPGSARFGQTVGQLDMPAAGDELHHFGWNACSSALCPYAPHPHLERRYLVVPGLRSSRIYLLDIKGEPTAPKLAHVIDAEAIAHRAGYSRPHTVHCGPEGLYVSALGSADGSGPGGLLLLDHQTFDVLGQWEVDRGPQFFAYDFWWHLGHDTLVTSEWGTPDMFENGLQLDRLLAGQYGHCLHFWDLRRRKHLQRLDLGTEHQLVFELRPAHDPARDWGFVNVVLSLDDLSSSIWQWYRDGDQWAIRKVITIPAEPAEPAQLPPPLQSFAAAPPLVSDINLSLDDRFLYVSCWGTGELHQYDVSNPAAPVLTGKVQLGGMVRHGAHPRAPDRPLSGGPQMVEVSRDGRRVYFTNSLYSAVDDQFYPEGMSGWMVKCNADPDGGLSLDEDFWLELDSHRLHQIRLHGGDCSSDSYCFS